MMGRKAPSSPVKLKNSKLQLFLSDQPPANRIKSPRIRSKEKQTWRNKLETKIDKTKPAGKTSGETQILLNNKRNVELKPDRK